MPQGTLGAFCSRLFFAFREELLLGLYPVVVGIAGKARFLAFFRYEIRAECNVLLGVCGF